MLEKRKSPEMQTASHRATTRPLVCLALILSALGPSSAAVQNNVWTYHNDNARTGLNAHETILTPKNVNQYQFGRIVAQPVDDDIWAQPLYMSQVNIPGKGTHS